MFNHPYFLCLGLTDIPICGMSKWEVLEDGCFNEMELR